MFWYSPVRTIVNAREDLTKIIHDLSSHESQLKSELDGLTTRAKAITGRLTQIQSAMAALRSTSQVKKIKMDDKQNRKVPAQAAIEEIILKILRDKKSVAIVDLMRQVKSQRLANGQSRIGLKSLFTGKPSRIRRRVQVAQHTQSFR